MGRLWIRGKDAKQKLNFLTTNSLDKLKYGKVQYNLLVNERGGVKDDITVYMMGEKEYFLCVNSINREKVLNWLASWGLTVEDWTFQSVQIALQGKSAEEKLKKYFEVSGLKRYNTGYTGEDGFEIYAPIKEGIEIFEALSKEVQTCGLMASLDRFVSREKDFLGKDDMFSKEPQRKLFGLELQEKGVPRKGYRIEMNGRETGVVSSGTFSPTLKKGIALCFVDRAVLRRYPFIR